MSEQSIGIGKIFICITDILIAVSTTAYALDIYSTRQEFAISYAALPWLALIAYFPTALFLGDKILTKVVRTFIFAWFAFIAYSLNTCVELLAQELDTMDALAEMKRTLLPVPYLSLVLAAACLIRFSPKRLSGAPGKTTA